MLKKNFNEIVSFMQATTSNEVAQVLALLPDGVRLGLAEEVQKLGDAHRYDANAMRAYYFERAGSGLTAWSWNQVYRPHEAGELIFRVVSSPGPIDVKLANECYALATGRAVTSPKSKPTGESEA